MSIKKVYDQGERLQKARKKMDWTRDQLAAYFDFGSGTVSMLENGQRRLNPGKAKHQRIIRWIKKVEHTQKDKARELFKLPTLNPRPSLNVTDSREKNSKNVARISGRKAIKKGQIVTAPPGKISKKGGFSQSFDNIPSRSANTSVSGDAKAQTPQLGNANLKRHENALAPFPKQPNPFEGAVPKTDGFCIVNGRLVFNFWRSPDPWEETKELATIECEYCHRHVQPETIQLYNGAKGKMSADLPMRELLPRYICTDCLTEQKTNPGILKAASGISRRALRDKF